MNTIEQLESLKKTARSTQDFLERVQEDHLQYFFWGQRIEENIGILQTKVPRNSLRELLVTLRIRWMNLLNSEHLENNIGEIILETSRLVADALGIVEEELKKARIEQAKKHQLSLEATLHHPERTKEMILSAWKKYKELHKSLFEGNVFHHTPQRILEHHSDTVLMWQGKWHEFLSLFGGEQETAHHERRQLMVNQVLPEDEYHRLLHGIEQFLIELSEMIQQYDDLSIVNSSARSLILTRMSA